MSNGDYIESMQQHQATQVIAEKYKPSQAVIVPREALTGLYPPYNTAPCPFGHEESSEFVLELAKTAALLMIQKPVYPLASNNDAIMKTFIS